MNAAASVSLLRLAACLAAFPVCARGDAALSADDRARYADVFAPRAVADLPQEASYTLCRLPDGRLRFYGRRLVGGEPRPAFIESDNQGLDWRLHLVAADDAWPRAMLYDPARRLAVGIDRVRRGKGPFYSLRLPDGARAPVRTDLPFRLGNFTAVMKLRGRDRWLVPHTCGVPGERGLFAAVLLSDDAGATWRRAVARPNVSTGPRPFGRDETPRWDNFCGEPTVAELADGSLWMIVRTSFDHPFAYRSHDGGDTWSGPEEMPDFWQHSTMPNLLRLSDGRLLFLWNNTQPMPRPPAAALPELREKERDGRSEFVFTNRDVLHAAVSEDDGRTWRGFRELALTPMRNQSDFRETGYVPNEMHDRSVHQSQMLELPDGKVLVAAGQGDGVAKMLLFDVRWLYENGRTEDFRSGLDNVTHHLYVTSLAGTFRGFSGHCALNRLPGAVMARKPDTQEKTAREAAWLVKIADPRVVWNNPGIVWNFPAARAGTVEIDCRIAGEGFRLGLADHWINPSDPYAAERCVASVPVAREHAGAGWTRVTVSWDCDGGRAAVVCGTRPPRTVPLVRAPRFGVSYLHLQARATGDDPLGTYFTRFDMKPRGNTK